MMDNEDPPPADAEKPKSKLAPLTAWRIRVPVSAEYTPAPTPPLYRRTAVLIGGGLAVGAVLAGMAVWLGAPEVSHRVVATSGVEKREAEVRRLQLAASYAPVALPSGVTVDRSSTLNYELAAWLAPSPLSERTFVFDRVRFPPGSAEVRDADKPALQVLSQILSAYPQAKVTIVGNGPGSLAIDRATAIRDAMLQLAADPAQLTAAAGNSSESAPELIVKLEMGVGSDLDA